MAFEKKPGKPRAVGGVKETSPPKITRRRFTKASVVAPVVMTLGSRPVWGACSLSGALSGNASNQHETAAGTSGYPPGRWGNDLELLVTTLKLKALSGCSCSESDATVNDAEVYDLAEFPLLTDWFGSCPGGSGGLPEEDVFTALRRSADSLEAQAAAAFLNAIAFPADFGAHPEDIALFVCTDLMDKTETLACMNSQGEDEEEGYYKGAYECTAELTCIHPEKTLTIQRKSKKSAGGCVVIVTVADAGAGAGADPQTGQTVVVEDPTADVTRTPRVRPDRAGRATRDR